METNEIHKVIKEKGKFYTMQKKGSRVRLELAITLPWVKREETTGMCVLIHVNDM